MVKPIVEVNFKNKKHLICCKTLDVAIGEVDAVKVDLQIFKRDLELKYDLPQDMRNKIDDKIVDLDNRRKKLIERQQMCGCE